ncbi:MAG: hypothetical protein QOJ79_1866 [Actinomycetota bacterium]|nr:hypothetical protein [Actinomycetota bacterium]
MTREPERGLLIEDYAVIGDTSTMALVGKDGSIDWLCLPRFDSEACFAKLLGTEDHGRWQIVPRHWSHGVVKHMKRYYLPGTLVLVTEWATDAGIVRLTDAMPPRDRHADVIRRVEGIEGEVEMAMRYTVRFAYGSAVPWVRHVTDDKGVDGVVAVAGPDALVLRGDVLPEPDRSSEQRAHHTYFTVKAGDTLDMSLSWFPSHEQMPHPHEVEEGLRRTESFWTDWTANSTYDGPYVEAVQRSLITLKGMTYQPTGGIVAAPTTSLPEHIGGPRNWDYRYCWLRDATLVLNALLSASHLEEAGRWRQWLLRAVAGAPDQLQILYGLAGERHLPEVELDWLPGYENSRPVRIGNAASKQFQLDVYGEVISALFAAREAGLKGDDESWTLQRSILTHLEKVMWLPDSGLWEVRGPERHFTYSKVMTWVAFDRAVRSVETHHLEGPVEHWRELRDAIHTEICAKAWNDGLGAFTQYYGGDELDASLLVMPTVGFLPATDPRFLSTVDAINGTLRSGVFVDRYQTKEHIDGLPPGEGSFLACSFWLVSALALAGRMDEATELFEGLLNLRNDVGLLAEEYDAEAGRMTGNFPQAFSHLALVEAASTLEAVGSSVGQQGSTKGSRD